MQEGNCWPVAKFCHEIRAFFRFLPNNIQFAVCLLMYISVVLFCIHVLINIDGETYLMLCILRYDHHILKLEENVGTNRYGRVLSPAALQQVEMAGSEASWLEALLENRSGDTVPIVIVTGTVHIWYRLL